MKVNLFFIILLSAIGSSCSKKNNVSLGSELVGKWKLTSVVDIANDSLVGGNTVDDQVIIDFVPGDAQSGLLYGTTTYNSFASKFIIAGDSSLILPYYVCAKTYDSPWGRAFLDNIGFAAHYSVSHGTLFIKTTNLMMLKFAKQE